MKEILAALGLSALTALAGAWYGHAEAVKTEDLKQARAAIEQRDEAIRERDKLAQAKQEADEAYEQTKQTFAVELGAVRADRERLRRAARAAASGAQAGAEAGSDAARAIGLDLFGEAADRYGDVAEEAGRLADKVTGLQRYVTTVCLAPP